MKPEQIINKLRADGVRITPTRQVIVDIFSKSCTPITPGELLAKLKGSGFYVNKTTVYRELNFLAGRGLVREVRLADNETRYESATLDHHHHLFCIKCKKINPVKLADGACLAAMSPKADGFMVTGHSIEMFGICADCQKGKNQKNKEHVC